MQPVAMALLARRDHTGWLGYGGQLAKWSIGSVSPTAWCKEPGSGGVGARASTVNADARRDRQRSALKAGRWTAYGKTMVADKFDLALPSRWMRKDLLRCWTGASQRARLPSRPWSISSMPSAEADGGDHLVTDQAALITPFLFWAGGGPVRPPR